MAVAMIPNLLSRVSKFRSSNRSKGSTSEKSSPSQPWIVVMNSVTDPGFSGKGRGVGHNPKILWRGRKGAFLVCKFGKKCLGQETKKLISDPPPHHLLLFVQRKRHVPPVPPGSVSDESRGWCSQNRSEPDSWITPPGCYHMTNKSVLEHLRQCEISEVLKVNSYIVIAADNVIE